MNKQAIAIAVLALLPVTASIAHATDKMTKTPMSHALPQPIEGASVAEAQGVVQSVNRDTREVTVMDANGGKASFKVGPEAKNFAQIKEGDKVNVRMTRDVMVKVLPGGGVRSAVETDAAASAPLGAKPSAGLAHRIDVVADIVKVDAGGGVVTVKGPQGNLLEVAVRDRAKLAGVKAGQQVELTYTETVAVAVSAAQ